MLLRPLLLGLALIVSSPLALAQIEPTDPTTSGGELIPEQAAFDVHFYDLAFDLDPARRHLAGEAVTHAAILFPTRHLVLDLDTTFTVVEARDLRHGALDVDRFGGRLRLAYDRTLQPGDSVAVQIRYEGAPRVAPNPPWEGGFTWVDRPDGTHWVGVSLQGEGADLWWPVKDHPSDKPDSVRVSVTVPSGHEAISNGHLRSTLEHADGRQTREWFVSTPINPYNVTLYVGPFERMEHPYTSVTGEALPVELYVLPEVRERAARQLPQFADQLRFMEETFGPYPFRADKYAVIHAPYLGMEHQTAIAYGDEWEDNAFGFDWLHLHELAHEWFGNLVTVPDWSHFWVHEGFAMYVEALYAEHLGGLDAYQRYLRERMRGRIANRQPVVPAPGGDTQSVYFGRTDATDQDVYFKGAWIIHTVRGVFRARLGEEEGDAAFFEALRRLTYPDPALEATTDGSALRFATSHDVQRTFEAQLGHSLDDLFRLYLDQPVLPQVEVTAEGEGWRLRWSTPEGYPLSIPVEVEQDGARRVVMMENGEALLPSGAHPVVDPDDWVLRPLR